MPLLCQPKLLRADPMILLEYNYFLWYCREILRMCHGLELARSFIFRGNCSSFLTQSHIHPKPFAEPDLPPGRQSIENNLPLPTGINLTSKLSNIRYLYTMMPTALSRAMALKKAGTLPTIGSVLVSAGSGFDECELCGNFFEISESSRSTPIKVPCVDTQCEPCARMWHILSSPTCLACYAHFTCPKLSGDRAQISSPQFDLDANDTIQWQSLADSQIESPLDFQDRYVAFYGADTKSDDDTVLDTGSPMREEDDETTATSELSDEDLREALILANNRIGTNFNIQEIEDEIPLAVLRRGTKTQLADILTQLCTGKASESDEDDGREVSSQQLNEDDSSDTTSRQDGDAALHISFYCLDCHQVFKSAGHLRQHMVVHTINHHMCSICGKILGNRISRRIHEQKHWETDSQRDERLQKAKVARDKSRASQKEKKRRFDRVP